MESYMNSCRLWMLVGILVISANSGCGCNKKSPPNSEPADLKLQIKSEPAPLIDKIGPPLKIKSDPLPVDNKKEAETKQASTPLSGAEQREFVALVESAEKATWSWEPNPNFKRQRPVALIVLNPEEDLPHAVGTTLAYAQGLANASWDVKILFRLTGNERNDLATLRSIQGKIDEANKVISRRNEEEEGKLPVDVAPLRQIGPPVVFKSAKDLESSVEQWLERSFLEAQQGTSRFSRPPFGGISFSGHAVGRSGLPDKKADSDVPNSALQFRVKENDSFDLSRLEALVLRKYQVPVWVLTDLCRPGKSLAKSDIDDISGIVGKLKPREFENFLKLNDVDQKAISEVESLRANAPPGFLHRNGAYITMLNATDRRVSLSHELPRLLHGRMGTLLDRQVPAGDFTRAHFKHFATPTTSITLEEAERWAIKQFVDEKIDEGKEKPQRPGLTPGVFSKRSVVYSTLRGKDVYIPQYPNLLNGGVSLSSGGFTVPELIGDMGAKGGEHFGELTVIRNQKAFDGDFRSIFKFKQPFSLVAGTQYKFVLLVSASGDPNDSLKFTTGVYDTKNRLLNPSFQLYGTAESHRTPIKRDGVPRLVHVPLTWFNNPNADPKPDANPEPEVATFEIQASPDQPAGNWKQDGRLTLHGVYLLPIAVADGELKADIERVNTKTPLSQMLIWDVPLHAKPEAVSIDLGGKFTVLEQSIKNHTGTWGAVGSVYPKLYAESGTQRLRIRVDADAKIDDSADVRVYVCSKNRIMATWAAPLKNAVAQEHVVQIVDSGLMQEVVVVARNYSGPLKITRLDIENIPAGK